MPKLAYYGDTSRETAASYLLGLADLGGWSVDYVPSGQSLDESNIDPETSLFVLSDYPAARCGPAAQYAVLEAVRAGAGLLMIGGWESFHGMGGDWDGTPLGEALPVHIDVRDDRVNFSQPAVAAICGTPHFLLDGLPFDEQPPTIGGLNRVRPKPESQTVLSVQSLAIQRMGSAWTARSVEEYPLLVLGECGRGRTAAFTSDVAPHWVGGFVDWGDARVTAEATGASPIEVGSWYARFFQALLHWTSSR